MRKSGAWLAVRALERVGVRYTFGIPGVHNTELYDELAQSELITPVLVTHEQGASFMGDAISRTSEHLGCLVIVPAAGMTHAMSGIGEAFLDGIPLLVISGGIRRDTGKSFQLHQLDQQRILEGITKGAFLVQKHHDIVPTIYRAAELARSGLPGPVFVEISSDLLLFSDEVTEPAAFTSAYRPPAPDPGLIKQAVEMLAEAKDPGLYIGWGARDATSLAIEVAECFAMPVSTTLQGISVFPHDHPLHTGMGYGPSAVPAAQRAFQDCDCLLAVGVRFAELATGSYGMRIPKNLIHVDIDPNVFHKNYPAAIAIESDAGLFFERICEAIDVTGFTCSDPAPLAERIRIDKEKFREEWTSKHNPERVSPGIFFRELRSLLPRDAFMTVDDGNHTFLAAEQFPVYETKHFISPTDFNCMGYAVPAAIAVKLAHRNKQVCAVVGDGAFMMTALEIITATTQKLGAIFFVFHDGELAQIAQLQQIPLKHKTCTVLGDLNVEGVALATGAHYLRMESDNDVRATIERAQSIASDNIPVIVDVNIDYSKKSVFTSGVVKTNLGRFPLREKVRFISRALKRHTIG